MEGYSVSQGFYASELNGHEVDASALLFSLIGYCDARDPRMLSTVAAIQRHLGKNNLLYRYKNEEDGLEGREGCFGICSFWLAENLALSGKTDEAIKVFESLLQFAGPAGLLSEEMDPQMHQLLGNYPQGFTHIGLIHAALAIQQQKEKESV